MRVRIWKGRSTVDAAPESEPDEVIELGPDENHLWQDDPHYHSPPVGFDIHPDDCPATLYVYTSDSVHPAGPRFHDDGYVDTSYWDRPIERGLPFPEDHDYGPFGCEVWGRVLFHVEEGLTR